jgi:hypothetical protein
MNAAITALLGLISKILPLVAGQAGPVTAIIEQLIALAPTLIDAGEEVWTEVQDIIAALKADPATTQAQLDALDAEDAKYDAAFEAAAAKAQAEDDAAGQG